MTVPAFPTSTDAGPRSVAGVTATSWPTSSTVVPSARRPAVIRAVSRLRSGATSRAGSRPSAASTSARLVCDLDPGTATVARTGARATGAAQFAVMARSWRGA